MKRGPKGKSAAQKKAARTERPGRKVVQLFDEPVMAAAPEASLEKPAHLTLEASEIWDRKIKRFAARNQSVAGCEDVLEEYCETQAEIRRRRLQNSVIDGAMRDGLSAFRGVLDEGVITDQEKVDLVVQMMAALRDFMRSRQDIPVAMSSALRVFGAEFYDTPASRKVQAGGVIDEKNPFVANLNRYAET